MVNIKVAGGGTARQPAKQEMRAGAAGAADGAEIQLPGKALQSAAVKAVLSAGQVKPAAGAQRAAEDPAVRQTVRTQPRAAVETVLSAAKGMEPQTAAQLAEQAAADAAALYEEAQKRAREAFASEESEVKSLVEMMKEAKERAEEQRERFKLPKNTNYGDAPMQAYSRLARARTQAQAGSAAGYARSKIAQLKSAMRQDPDNAERIRAAIHSLQKAVTRAGRKKRELQQEQLTERRRVKAALRKENQKAQRLRRELCHRRTMRGIRESGYLRECEVENRLQDQLQASRMELRLQMQQLTAAATPSPEAAAQQYAMQAGMGGAELAAPAASVDIQA